MLSNIALKTDPVHKIEYAYSSVPSISVNIMLLIRLNM